MAESSAKSLCAGESVIRRRAGAHVELINSCVQLPDNDRWFDPAAWTHSAPVGTGRGANWYVGADGDEFVLRHFRRGGAIAKVLGDKYWFGSEAATRSFAEFKLLEKMRSQGLPVPEPVAAGYDKAGPWYTAQLLTRRIPGATSWSSRLDETAHVPKNWSNVGIAVARLHAARVDHADLNAHNILIDGEGRIFVIDFDKSVERATSDSSWREANLMRLKRSLTKLQAFSDQSMAANWNQLIESYTRQLSQSS